MTCFLAEPPLHIGGDIGGNAFGLFAAGTAEQIVGTAAKQTQPLLKIRSLQAMLFIEVAVNIHRMAVITRSVQQQLFPVGINMLFMYFEIDLGNFQKNRCQSPVFQYFCIECIDQSVHIGTVSNIVAGNRIRLCLISYFRAQLWMKGAVRGINRAG